MKKIFTLMLFCAVFLYRANAQCTPDFTNTVVGLNPIGDSIPCASQGVAYDQTIQIYFPDTVRVSGSLVTIYYVTIDSINNLPCGLKYAFDRADRTYTPTSTTPARGCMHIIGTTSDSIGQYLLKISVKLSTSALSGTWADASTIPGFGSSLTIFFRVKGAGACAPVDTTFPANKTASCKTIDYTGIEPISDQIASFEISPNPVTANSMLSFISPQKGNAEMMILNTMGAVMKKDNILVNEGENQFPLESGNLANGIYYLYLRNGEHSMTKKFILNK